MTEELITVILVNYNTSTFIKINLYAFKKLMKNKYKVIICDNGSRYLDKSKLKKIAGKYSNVELFFRKQSTSGSMGHGEALNLLIENIDTPYGVILDADATLLKKGWDDILIDQFDDKVKIIGCPPVENPIKPTDFPSVYATLFDTKTFKSLKIDMRPKNPKIGLDTGWEMREKFFKSGYQCKVLESRNTREYKEGLFRDLICTEYYLEGYGEVFACHFGRGATLGAAKYYKGNRKILSRGRVDQYKYLKYI
jgi:glycosyltransferase involved in cell wall biosynthesis